jgi:hypothetical protein
MADILMPEFVRQKEIARTADAIVEVRRALHSSGVYSQRSESMLTDIPDIGSISYFNSNYSNRNFEVVKHGNVYP